MTIQQLSIFLENKMGHLADVTTLLAEAGIDIRALSIADTNDFGILRLIVNDPEKAVTILKEAEVMVITTEVVAVALVDKPGAFAEIVRILSDAEINMEYLYAFLSQSAKQAFAVIRCEDTEACIKLLTEHNVSLLSKEQAYHL